MRETKFILTSLQSFNLSFPLLFHVIQTAILDSLHRHPDAPHFSYFHPDFPPSMLIFRTSIPSLFLAFPPVFSVLPSFCSSIPHFGFYRQPAQFMFFKNLFYETSCFSSKTNTPLFYYCVSLGTKLFTPSMTSSVLSPKLIYLMVPQVKNL